MTFERIEKPFTRRYEFGRMESYKRADVERAVLEAVQAAMTLRLPVTVESVHFKEFRNGGNVHKADCYGYRVIVGEVTDLGET